MKNLLLIDAHSIIHRCFHALPPLTAPDGRPTQALYGLSSVLLKLFREEKPEYAAALFDRPEPTFRKERYEEYKAQRAAAPDELVDQINEAHALFKQFGIRTFEKPGFEADDLIATLAELFRADPDIRVIILTGDLDTLQLVENEKVVVRTFRKGISDTFTYDEKAIRERYGLHPDQLVDYKALVGDVSDNIKGVPGIGPKTASELLSRFGTLEHIYRNMATLPKAKVKLENARAEAELAKHLVMLDRNVPLGVRNINELGVAGPLPSLTSYFSGLGFETLIRRFENHRQGTILTSHGEPLPEMPLGDIVIFSSLESIPDETLLSPKTKVGFELKQLLKKYWSKGKDVAPPYYDLGVAFWLLNPDFKKYDPAATAKKFLGKEWRGTPGDFYEALNFTKGRLNLYKLTGVFGAIEMPLLRILAEMEAWGIQVSLEKLKALEDKIEKNLQELTTAIYAQAGESFNINSPRQIGTLLFKKLQIPTTLLKKTLKGEFSTNAGNLELLRDAHPIVPLILLYRESFKIQSTYVRPIQALIDSQGRLHTEFVQTGTATGRLSSQSPNLQNIPQESPWARELRGAFEATQGHSLLALDYSQLELRIVAALSGDTKMKDAFVRNEDIHKITAATVLSIPPERVGTRDRRLAKALNFGLIYGMGVLAFSKTSRLSRAEAQKFIDAYFREFSLIPTWQEKVRSEARTFGYVQTLTGRRRYLPELASGSPRLEAEALRAAVNHPVQGLEADIMKMAMIEIKKMFEKKGWWGQEVKMLLSIHDELLFEVRDDMIKKITPQIKKAMEEVFDLTPSLKVDVSLGKDWGHLKKMSSANGKV